jgi:polar amino acid transport system substrate-binding protein
MRRSGKTLFAIPLVSIALVSLTSAAQVNTLRLVSTAWSPFTNEKGQPRFAQDLVEAAFARIGLAVESTIVEAAQFTPALMTEAFDGSAAAWKDADRERILFFSEPYLENRLVLVARRGTDATAKALTALKGKRIAIVEGYSYGDAITTSGVIVTPSRSEEDSLTLLLANKADYVLMDELVVQYILENHPTEARRRLSIGTNALLTRPLHLAIRRSRPDAEAIIKRFNAQLRGMVSDHTYHRLLHVSWIRADVDGDGVPEFVPQSDRSGTTAPQHAYTLFASGQPTTKFAETPSRFYMGGHIYEDWASVPNRYKVEDSNHPDPSRSTASIFRFTW